MPEDADEPIADVSTIVAQDEVAESESTSDVTEKVRDTTADAAKPVLKSSGKRDVRHAPRPVAKPAQSGTSAPTPKPSASLGKKPHSKPGKGPKSK